MTWSRPVKPARCSTCHADILRGYNRNWLALLTDLDPQPIDQVGEALAVLTGRRTYDLRRQIRGHGREMEERNAISIRDGNVIGWPIHAEHRCHHPLPAAPAAEKEPAMPPSSYQHPEGVPF